MLTLCSYTMTEMGVMSYVCSMAFLWGNTLVKVSLLQAGTIAIWAQVFKSDVKPLQTNKTHSFLTYLETSFLHHIHLGFSVTVFEINVACFCGDICLFCVYRLHVDVTSICVQWHCGSLKSVSSNPLIKKCSTSVDINKIKLYIHYK